MIALDLLGILLGISIIATAFKALIDRAQRTDLHQVTGSVQHTFTGTMRHDVTGGYTVQHQVAGTVQHELRLSQEDRDRFDRLQAPAQVQANRYGRLSSEASGVLDLQPVTLRRLDRSN